jgi:hypothetical protein
MLFKQLKEVLLTPELMSRAAQNYTQLKGAQSKSFNFKLVEDINKLKRITRISNNSDKKRREKYLAGKRKQIDQNNTFQNLETLSSEIQGY